MNYKIRYYQDEAVSAIIENIGILNPLVALPTGSGKSIVIADFIKRMSHINVDIIILSHVKEILEQNADKIRVLTGTMPAIYSAMLGKRQIGKVTVAGIQSIYNKANLFHNPAIVIIDEAHIVSTEDGTMYDKFFKTLNNHVRVGLTATPYRTGTGFIYGKDKYFDKLVCDYSKGEKFNQLIRDGYLCKLTTKRTKAEMDTTGIRIVAGDYNEKDLSEKFDRESVTEPIVKEIIAAGRNRKKWLVFAIDINHAEHIAETLIRSGIPTVPVHSKMGESGFDREKHVDMYRDGMYKCAVTVNVLSTGYDDPTIDLIAILRPTESPIFHVQSNGRGSRIAEGKKDCLVLDFAGNTARLGPINDPVIRVKGKGKGKGDPITKECPKCFSIVHASAKFCPDCNFKFPIQHKLNKTASFDKIIEDGKPNWYDVNEVKYEVNVGYGAPSSIIVNYICEGGFIVRDWVFVEHRGFAKHKADHWVKYRGGSKCNSVKDFMAQKERLSKPKAILASKKGKYFEVTDARF